jgi:hypothetical protein
MVGEAGEFAGNLEAFLIKLMNIEAMMTNVALLHRRCHRFLAIDSQISPPSS